MKECWDRRESRHRWVDCVVFPQILFIIYIQERAKKWNIEAIRTWQRQTDRKHQPYVGRYKNSCRRSRWRSEGENPYRDTRIRHEKVLRRDDRASWRSRHACQKITKQIPSHHLLPSILVNPITSQAPRAHPSERKKNMPSRFAEKTSLGKNIGNRHF